MTRDLFRLDQIVDMNHPLAKLASAIDWNFLENSFGAVRTDRPGHRPLPTRLMAGIAILMRAHQHCQRRPGQKIYSLRAREVECIGKGNAHREGEPDDWRPVRRSVKALRGNLYDGHTLATVMPAMEQQIGVTLNRILADAGYRKPQRAARLSLQGLHRRPETAHDRTDLTAMTETLSR